MIIRLNTRILATLLLVMSMVTASAQSLLQMKPFSPSAQYMVIDLSGGPNAKIYPVSYTKTPPDLDFDTCRTKELWLRLIPAGTFIMGSPDDELGRKDNEILHQVTLTQPFYIGVFQVTQKQYELVTGKNPSASKGATRPVENVSYDMVRGTSEGAEWPKSNNVDSTSFFGKLRERTAVLADLPTESQWEYACRAGTTTALNSGKNLADRTICPNMAEVGRYAHNWNDGKDKYADHHTNVGMYKPNAWGLYDMHGNVCEWCLDWYGGYGNAAVADPKGTESGDKRIRRGGSWIEKHGHLCRSASRHDLHGPGIAGFAEGFRIVVLPSPGQVKPIQPPAPSSKTEQLGASEELLAMECAEFKAVWNVYKENAEKINAELQPKFDALQQQYQKALETMKSTAQNRGDLEKVQAVIAEITRFEETKNIPSTPDEETIAEIKTLHANAAKPFAALEKDRASRMTSLTKRYGQALEQLQASLVKAGKLDEAAAVKAARERAKRAE